ncbi:MAG: hypothetical protein AB2793_03115 [Candidatus Thiodiazotropha sp.]
MKLFLSWSGHETGNFAMAFKPWVRRCVNQITPWVSSDPSDLSKGQDDYSRILEAAQSADACISFITEQNINSPWLLFEAGLFYGKSPRGTLYTILCGNLSHESLKEKGHPLSNIYHAYMTEKDITDLLLSLNYDHNILDDESIIKDAVKETYRKLAEQYENVFDQNQNTQKNSDRQFIDAVASLGLDEDV